MEPVISVLMSVYKEPLEWIRKSIDSILDQSYKNKEIIVIVDNPDNREAIDFLYARAKLYTNLRVLINEKNIGLVSSLNRGLELCTGSFVARMDADDFSFKERLEKQISFMLKHNLDIVGCGITLFDGHGYSTLKTVVFPMFCRKMVKYCSCLPHPTWLVKKAVYDELKGYRDIDTCEDYDFLNRAILKGYRIGNVPDILFEYRINESSISNTKRYKQFTTMRFLSDRFVKDEVITLSDYKKFIESKEYQTNVEQNRVFTDQEIKSKKNHNYIECIRLLRYKEYRRQKYINKKIALLGILDNFTQQGYKYARSVKHFIDRAKLRICYYFDLFLCTIKKQPQKVNTSFYVIGTEDYGNIGDHQIALSIIDFLKKNFPQNTIIEIPASEYYRKRRRLIFSIARDDIIILTGGGNFGNVYFGAQLIRRDVIKFWKNNLKIVMPVTIYYDDNNAGRRFVKKDKSYFQKKNNVSIITREDTSFKLGMSLFNCDVLLTPDIVLETIIRKGHKLSNSALICLRSDLESKRDSNLEKMIRDKISNYFNIIMEIDTQKFYTIPLAKRESEVNKCLELFKEANLVITDRLHGMIFSAITSTPCIVVGNYNHKVIGSYKWLERLGYIKYMNNIDELQEFLESGFWNKKFEYDFSLYKKDYLPIINAIKGDVKYGKN